MTGHSCLAGEVGVSLAHSCEKSGFVFIGWEFLVFFLQSGCLLVQGSSSCLFGEGLFYAYLTAIFIGILTEEILKKRKSLNSAFGEDARYRGGT